MDTKQQYEQAINDMGDMVESTAQLIDMHFTQFAEYLEGKNIGTLKAYRALMERNLEQADVVAKKLTESTVTTFKQEDRIKLGSVYGAISKIIDRIGYMDYKIKSLELDFSK